MLISIGQFSKICSVSIKTLRYYDSLGILKPARVDEFTGYRYYDEAQLETMIFINRLKRYGFSLADIKRLISSDKSTLILNLKEQSDVIKGEIDYKRMLLKEIEGVVNKYERTGDFMNYADRYEINLIETEDIAVLSSRQRMGVDEFGKYYGKLFEKIAREGINSSGRALAVYHDTEFDEKDSDIEVGIEILDKQSATRILKGGLCAKTVHKGSYANLTEGYAAVVKWINSNGYSIAAPPYEFYRKSHIDGLPVEEWETDIYFPINTNN